VGELPLLLLVVGGFVTNLVGLGWLASRTRRRRGVGGAALSAAMAAHDELFHPNAHQSHIEIVAQDRRVVPISSPGDRWRQGRREVGRSAAPEPAPPTDDGRE
jgi:hypothetical protein